MHKAKTSRLPRIFTSLLALCGLLLGGSVVLVAPANAVSWSGCSNASAGTPAAQGCQTSVDITLNLTPASVTVAPAGLVVGATVSTAKILNVSTQLTTTQCTGGLAFSIATPPTLGGSWTLAINSSTGVITYASGSGSATAGSYVTAVTGDCTVGTGVGSYIITRNANLTLVIGSSPALNPSTQTVTETVGTAITATTAFTAVNFSPAPTYAIAPALPASLLFDSNTGVISGTANATQSATSYTITATNTNSQTATATVSITIGAAPTVAAVEPPPPSRKVTICHRTHATTNPYVRITVDYNAVNRKSGHQGHDEIFAGEHVFKAGIYKRAKDKDWGDIIPADPSGLNRWQPLNWTTLGAQIYNGTVDGCPSYDPVAYYNAQREAGVPEKKLKQEMAEIEAELKEGNPGTSRVDPATLKYTGNNSSVAEQENDKVTICHRTRATTNPYVRITVSTSSITNPAGHMEHDEIYDGHHVFDSSVTYPNNKKLWGDIIPADPTGKNRWQPLNWTALGQSIYNGTTAGCGEQTLQQVYDKLREEGLPKKEIIDELEKQKNVDEDPKDIEELEYKGNDPETKKNEPKEPQDPNTAPTQSLSGQIWLDRNKDGLKDPDEPLMPNVEINLYKDGAPVGKLVTDKNGFFQFLDLAPGDYKVLTTIPQDLDITYDSEGLHQGEMNATVPTGGRTFTWAGLVGKTTIVDKQLLEEILKNNPKALPTNEIPSWLKSKIAGKSSPYKAPVLADTGSNTLTSLVFGLLLMLAGAGFSVATRKRR